MSYTYNAPKVFKLIRDSIVAFRTGTNPAQANAAAAQVDVIGHSMGGLVARQITTLADYAGPESFQVGNIHKIITIGTPHYGSPFAELLLQDTCVATAMAKKGMIAFGPSVLVGGAPATGAVYDLQRAQSSGCCQPSGWLSTKPPVAATAGWMDASNIANVGYKLTQLPIIQGIVQAGCLAWGKGLSPLAPMMTKDNWPLIFGGNDVTNSDGIVGVTSQLAGRSGQNMQAASVIHSAGLYKLGFSGQTELTEPVQIPPAVTACLNAPVSGGGTSCLLQKF